MLSRQFKRGALQATRQYLRTSTASMSTARGKYDPSLVRDVAIIAHVSLPSPPATSSIGADFTLGMYLLTLKSQIIHLIHL